MRMNGAKAVLQAINKQNTVLVKVSIWRHSGKRLSLIVPFYQIEKFVDKDMHFGCDSRTINLKGVNGFSFKGVLNQLRIIKIDSYEIKGEINFN